MDSYQELELRRARKLRDRLALQQDVYDNLCGLGAQGRGQREACALRAVTGGIQQSEGDKLWQGVSWKGRRRRRQHGLAA